MVWGIRFRLSSFDRNRCCCMCTQIDESCCWVSLRHYFLKINWQLKRTTTTIEIFVEHLRLICSQIRSLVHSLAQISVEFGIYIIVNTVDVIAVDRVFFTVVFFFRSFALYRFIRRTTQGNIILIISQYTCIEFHTNRLISSNILTNQQRIEQTSCIVRGKKRVPHTQNANKLCCQLKIMKSTSRSPSATLNSL